LSRPSCSTLDEIIQTGISCEKIGASIIHIHARNPVNETASTDCQIFKEIFDVSMIQNALDLANQGLMAQPIHFDFVMGLKGAIPGNLFPSPGCGGRRTCRHPWGRHCRCTALYYWG